MAPVRETEEGMFLKGAGRWGFDPLRGLRLVWGGGIGRRGGAEIIVLFVFCNDGDVEQMKLLQVLDPAMSKGVTQIGSIFVGDVHVGEEWIQVGGGAASCPFHRS